MQPVGGGIFFKKIDVFLKKTVNFFGGPLPERSDFKCQKLI